MARPLSTPLLGIGEDWPDRLIVLHDPASDRFACYCHQGIHGLASFEYAEDALEFGTSVDLPHLVLCGVTFDEAREIAKGRPLPVVSLMLLDPHREPLVHFVR